MSRPIEVVSRPVNDPRLPDVLAQAAAMLERAASDGLLDRCEDAFQMGRRNGHTGKGIATFLMVFLLSERLGGIRPFAERHRSALKRLGRLVGLRGLPSAAAMSRALGRLESSHAAAFSDGVISSPPGLSDMMKLPDVLHLDETEQGWHVLDLDPTVKAFRQRRLDPSGERPEGVRIAPGCPGYTGHKRGEIRIRSVPVLHAGTGCWLAHRMWATTPHVSVSVAELVQQSLAVMRGADISPHQVILRMDGEFGSAGCMSRVRACGVHFVTRLSRYSLFRRTQVAEALRVAEWRPIRGDRPRESAELGLFTLHPSEGSADEGEAPTTVRVVVSRRIAGEREHHGVQEGPYVYELFATSLDPSFWSSSSVVELYSGRASMENRFAQEDRELNLGRTFSYNPSGQAVVESLGLLLWNYLTVIGCRDSDPSRSSPTPPAPVAWMREAMQTPAEAIPTAPDGLEEGKPEEVVEERPESTVEDKTERQAVPVAVPFPSASKGQLHVLSAILSKAYGDLLNWGWSLNEDVAALRCPNGKLAFPFSIVSSGPGRPKPQIIVRTEWSACNGCPLRSECFSSTRPDIPKQVARAVETSEAEWVRGFLKHHPPQRKRRSVPKRPRRPRKRRAIKQAPVSEPLYRPLSPHPHSSHHLQTPTFSPGDCRAHTRHYLGRILSVEIRLSPLSRRKKTPNPRHRRLTWVERRARWKSEHLPSMRFEVGPNLAGSKSCPISILLGR